MFHLFYEILETFSIHHLIRTELLAKSSQATYYVVQGPSLKARQGYLLGCHILCQGNTVCPTLRQEKNVSLPILNNAIFPRNRSRFFLNQHQDQGQRHWKQSVLRSIAPCISKGIGGQGKSKDKGSQIISVLYCIGFVCWIYFQSRNIEYLCTGRVYRLTTYPLIR